MRITIFTPTYNRGYILPKLYNSLLNQSNKNFEWLIIDDGSGDGTKEIVENFIKQNKITIRYYYQKNSGKAMAYNKGIEFAKSDLFTCVDSDDYLVNDAIKIILETWKYNHEGIGILAKKIKPNGEDHTFFNVKDIKYSKLKEADEKNMVYGDTFLIYKTSIIKKFRFPCYENEKFVPETYLYDQLDQVGTLYLLNKGLYIAEYLDDGYTKKIDKVIANNPKGYLAFVEQRILLDKRIKDKFFDTARAISVLFVLNQHKIYWNHIFISLLAYPLGYFLYIKRFKKWIK